MLSLRSLNHNESAFVQFQNKTNRIIDVVWINYDGHFIKYKTLQPHESININTYKTHPWIFVDRNTGIKMKVGSQTIFYPLSNVEIIRRLGFNIQHNFRVPVEIRLPLFSLRQISLQTVLGLLRDLSDVNQLHIPITLKREILKISDEKNEILSKYEW